MKVFGLVVALLFTGIAYGQDCNALVNDEAGVIKEPARISIAAAGLINQGADVKIITVANLARYGNRLSDVEKFYERYCPEWQAGNGSRKANLFAVIVAPNQRKKNVFFGGAYAGALPNEDIVNTIFSQAANSYFRNGEFGDGIAAALNDFNNKVLAFHDQAKHPTVVTQAATDLKPIAGSFNFLFILLGIGALLGLILYLRARTKKNNEEAKATQQEAIQAQQEASRLFLAANTESANYERVATKYTNLSNSASCDPNQEGLTVALYTAIKSYWTGMAYDIKMMDRIEEIPTPSEGYSPYSSHPQGHTKYKTAASNPESGQYPTPTPTYTTPAPQTTVINNGNSGFVEGMMVDELLHEHHHSRRDDEEGSIWGGSSSLGKPRSSSDDSSSSSGSDSSWSSSDSSSSGSDSSWSDSSSSSSFDSGSSGSDSSW